LIAQGHDAQTTKRRCATQRRLPGLAEKLRRIHWNATTVSKVKKPKRLIGRSVVHGHDSGAGGVPVFLGDRHHTRGSAQRGRYGLGAHPGLRHRDGGPRAADSFFGVRQHNTGSSESASAAGDRNKGTWRCLHEHGLLFRCELASPLSELGPSKLANDLRNTRKSGWSLRKVSTALS
jgi:hypothetical protein